MRTLRAISTGLFRALFTIMCVVGRPFGGVRPRRLYDAVGRRAFPEPRFRWMTNRWGDELYLSGHYHIDRNIMAFGTYDLPLHRAMRSLIEPGMVCVDVGANLGEMALHMARLVGPRGSVLAFEPAPHVYRRLCEHVRRNGVDGIVECHRIALTDRSGTIAMSIPDEDADNQGLGSLVGDRGCGRVVKVEAATLDELLAGGRVHFIKLDIQGGEWRFLAGAAETLALKAPILATEVSPDDLAVDGRTSREYLVLLARLGYQIHRLGRTGLGRRIDPERVARNFAATNVICIPNQP